MSEQLTKLVVDVSTGDETIVPLSPEEIAQMEQQAIEAQNKIAERAAEEAAKAAAKASAIEKLTALGLTAEEIAAL